MAAMDFPNSPTNGQTTTDGRYYFDSSVGSTGAWRSTPLPVGGLPAGSIMAWGTNTPPANWLLADGSAVSRSVYSSLFAVIGTQYGTGDGTITFNLPDLRGRVPVGKNAATFGTLGATGGAETHTHGSSGMIAGWNAFVANGTILYNDYHERSGPNYTENRRANTPSGAGFSTSQNESANAGIGIFGNTDSGSSLPPYQVVNYIIKASAGWTAGDSELATRLGVLEQNPNITGSATIAGNVSVGGRITAQSQPAFMATASNSVFSVAQGAAFPFNTVSVNVGNGFNTSTNRFTAPVAGTYMFTASVFSQGSVANWLSFYRNGAILSMNDHVLTYNGGTNVSVSLSIILSLAANDYVQVGQRPSSGSVTTYGGHSFFAGHLIG